MDGDSIVEYQKPTFIGLVWQVEDKCFTEIATGYNHAVMLAKSGKVYVWGSGKYGQLGLTSEVVILLDPYPVDSLIFGESERIVHVFSTANHSFALSSLGMLYHWGVMGKSEGEIVWSPEICRLDDNMRVTDVGGLQHEIMVMDANGSLSTCVLAEMDREFRPVARPSQFTEDFRKLAGCGIGHQVYLRPFLIPDQCKFTLSTTKWATGEWTNARLKLASNTGAYSVANVADLSLTIYLSAKVAERRYPHDFNKYAGAVLSACGTAADEEEKKDVDKGKYLMRSIKKAAGVNDVPMDCQLRISELEESELVIDLSPSEPISKAYLHVLLNETYVIPVPIEIEIIPGKAQAQKKEQEEARRREMRARAEEERRREAEEKAKKLEAAARAKKEREEMEGKRRKATEARAADALKELKRRIKEQEKKMAEERKARLELVTGGGFDLSKLPKKS